MFSLSETFFFSLRLAFNLTALAKTLLAPLAFKRDIKVVMLLFSKVLRDCSLSARFFISFSLRFFSSCTFLISLRLMFSFVAFAITVSALVVSNLFTNKLRSSFVKFVRVRSFSLTFILASSKRRLASLRFAFNLVALAMTLLGPFVLRRSMNFIRLFRSMLVSAWSLASTFLSCCSLILFCSSSLLASLRLVFNLVALFKTLLAPLGLTRFRNALRSSLVKFERFLSLLDTFLRVCSYNLLFSFNFVARFLRLFTAFGLALKFFKILFWFSLEILRVLM